MELTYRQLQTELKSLPCEVRRNSKYEVLAAEYTRLTGTEVTKSAKSANSTKSDKSAKFDWEGLATDRKDAVATLKAFREAGHAVPKLNATNVVLRSALAAIADGDADATPVAPTPVTKPAAKPAPSFPYGFTRDKAGRLVPRTAPRRAVAAAKPTTVVTRVEVPVTTDNYCDISDPNSPEVREARLAWALNNLNGVTYQPWTEKHNVVVTRTGTHNVYTRTLNDRPAA